MKKNENEIEIVTMSKAKFDKLSKEKQRVAVAQDVLDRIKLSQIAPKTGQFCEIVGENLGYTHGKQLKDNLADPNIKCEACAKGGLFLAYIGIVNNYKVGCHIFGSENLESEEMGMLQKIFSKQQLSLIETAFEGRDFSWNERLSPENERACRIFYDKHSDSDNDDDAVTNEHSRKRLEAICQNIIKNKGTFKLTTKK